VNVAGTVATLLSFYVFLQIVEEVALHRDTMMLNGSQVEGGGDGGAGERSVINHVIESFVEASMGVLAAAAEEFTHSDEGGRTVDERGERERGERAGEERREEENHISTFSSAKYSHRIEKWHDSHIDN